MSFRPIYRSFPWPCLLSLPCRKAEVSNNLRRLSESLHNSSIETRRERKSVRIQRSTTAGREEVASRLSPPPNQAPSLFRPLCDPPPTRLYVNLRRAFTINIPRLPLSLLHIGEFRSSSQLGRFLSPLSSLRAQEHERELGDAS